MTVCIATICDGGKSILSVSDERVSIGEMSADTLLKCDFILNGNWIILFAGDVSDATTLYQKIDKNSHSLGDDLESVIDACRSAYSELVSQDAASFVLGPLNLTLERLLEDGTINLPESVFSRLVTEIQQHQLTRNPSCLLTAGFDAKENAHVFTINHHSEIHHADRLGFAAIGSGSPSALADLYFHRYQTELTCDEAIYRALSAKFMAERASDVGDTTFVVVMRKDEPAIMPDHDQIEAIRDMWNDEGCARLPNNYRERVKEILKSSSS